MGKSVKEVGIQSDTPPLCLDTGPNIGVFYPWSLEVELSSDGLFLLLLLFLLFFLLFHTSNCLPSNTLLFILGTENTMGGGWVVQSLEIDYSVTISVIVMKLPDNKNESPKNALKKCNANICPKYEKMQSSEGLAI